MEKVKNKTILSKILTRQIRMRTLLLAIAGQGNQFGLIFYRSVLEKYGHLFIHKKYSNLLAKISLHGMT
jgi:hypothetical protein